MLAHDKRPWVQLRSLRKARILLILPCNAAACIGNYFRAEVYTKKGWNTWREADWCLHDLRKKEIELNSSKQIITKKSVEDIVKEKDEKNIKSLENYLKQNTNNESNKKSIIIDESLIRENGMVRFKEEFKNGLGPVIKFGFDGRPIG